MSSIPALKASPAPETWYAPTRYGPRVSSGGNERWFLRAGAVPFVRDLAVEPPRAAPKRPRAADVAAAFARTYDRWDIPRSEAAAKNLALVSDRDAVYVVTGQQPGLLSGPLYTIYKAVTCIAAAEALARRWSRAVLPVFWVAGEDHDLDEVRGLRLPGPDDTEPELRLPWSSDRRPVSDWMMDAAGEAVLDRVIATLADRRCSDDVRALVDLYRGHSLASGFARFLEALLGRHGLLLIDPEELRPLAAPIFHRAVFEPGEVLAAVEKGAEIPRRVGLDPFVASRFPLFYLVDGEEGGSASETAVSRARHHLTLAHGELVIDGDGPGIDPGEIRRAAESDPGRFSPGALLRPLVQQFVLPTALTIGGPSEVGYFSQLAPLAECFDLEPPPIGLRLQATVIDGKAARLRERLGIDFETLAAARGPEDLIPAAGDRELSGATRDAERALERLRARIGTFDFREDAQRRLERGLAKADSAVASLAARIDRELRQKDEEAFAAAKSLWHYVFPGGSLQERRWNILHPISRYGVGWIDALLDLAREEPGNPDHVLISVASIEDSES